MTSREGFKSQPDLLSHSSVEENSIIEDKLIGRVEGGSVAGVAV